jgi:hypothetical protein
LARACADAGDVIFKRYEFERGDLVDIDETRGPRESHRHHRNQALTARDQFDVFAVPAQQFARVVDRSGAHIIERGWLQIAL